MRLIDADKLSYYDEKFADGEIYMVVHAPQIDNAPTAYDMNKVIEQLEERKRYLLKDFVLANKAEEVKERTMARINEIDGLIEIVKSGFVGEEIGNE